MQIIRIIQSTIEYEFTLVVVTVFYAMSISHLKLKHYFPNYDLGQSENDFLFNF